MAFSPAGVLFVSVPSDGTIVALPDTDRDRKADRAIVFARGLNCPHGLAFFQGALYVAETNRVVRLTDSQGNLHADRKEVIVPDLPAGGGHWTRTIGFGPDGSGPEIYARGLRNSVGFVWHPNTGEIWATDNGRDWLGDDLPPEEINIVRAGSNYGWPYCYGNQIVDKEFNRRDFCATTVPPVLEIPAHSAPLGLAFYTGPQFPREYRGNIFVALHGSWNRSVPTGYKLIRIRLDGDKPGRIEDFATGWLVGESAWGRPVQPIVGPDGSLYLSDDRAGVIYRINYSGPTTR